MSSIVSQNVLQEDNTKIIVLPEEFAGSQLRMTPDKKWVSVYDILRSMGYQNGGETTEWKIIYEKHPDITWKKFKFSGRGQRETPVMNNSTTQKLIKLVYSKSRIHTLEEKRKFLGDVDYYPVRVYTEIEIHDNIRKVFSDTRIVFQHAVGSYKVDLYFPEYKLCVECDENGHMGYSAQLEKTRETFISETIGCVFIRYDPYDQNFDIFYLINEIRTKMKQRNPVEIIGLHSDLEIEFVRENTKLQIAQLEADVRKIEALEKTKQIKMRLDMKLHARQTMEIETNPFYYDTS